jgi:hypothetical protein
MLQPINIDVREMQQLFNISERDLQVFSDNIVSELAMTYLHLWYDETKVLRATRKSYREDLKCKKISDSCYEVGIDQWLSNAVEQGIEPFDEKEGFRKSSKVHTKEGGGWYLTIPFRHATYGAEGDDPSFSGVMPKEVSKQAKKLGNTGQQLDISTIPQQYQEPRIRAEVISKSQVFEEYKNKASIYAGLIRKVDSTGRGNYFTFRRVSDKNEGDNSWINTGIEARNFHEKAFQKMNLTDTVNQLAENYIKEMI